MAVSEFAGCSNCGSWKVYPKHWVGGFFPGINANRSLYRCKNCDHEGFLLYFRTKEERERYAEERRAAGVQGRP